MSIALMTAAWKSALPAGRKMVLLALCDNANDHGECHPSIGYLANKCSMGERTVQQHISDMERAGIVQRRMRFGTTTMYYIYPGRFNDPAEFAPPEDPPPGGSQSGPAKTAGGENLHPTPAGVAGLPPQPSRPSPAKAAPRTPSEPSGKPSSNPGTARGTRLPDDWTLPDDWRTWAKQTRPAWSDAYIAELADGFRDYWVAKPGTAATKLDWPATWRTWVRNSRGPAPGHGGGGLAWFSTDETVLAKGRELGMIPRPGEQMGTFKARVGAAIENGGKEPPPANMSRVGMTSNPVPAGQAVAQDAPRGEKPAGLQAAVDAARGLVGKAPRKTGTED